MEDTETK